MFGKGNEVNRVIFYPGNQDDYSFQETAFIRILYFEVTFFMILQHLPTINEKPTLTK